MCPSLRLAPPSSRTPAISYFLTSHGAGSPPAQHLQSLQPLSRVAEDIKSILASGSGGLKTRCYTTSVVGCPHLDFFGYDSPLHPPPFSLTHQSIHTRLYFLLVALASRRYMEADLFIRRDTVLDVPPYTSRHHILVFTCIHHPSFQQSFPSSSSSSLSSWSGLIWVGCSG